MVQTQCNFITHDNRIFPTYLINVPNLNTIRINLIINKGANDEQENEIGVAHFLEHMSCKGTKSRTDQDIIEIINKIGGYSNACTYYK